MRRIVWAVLSAACAFAAEATIEIDASHPAPYRIPRTIFGTFLEPIGKSIYPGLWAQVLENPSFEENLWSADNLRRRIDDEPALARASASGLPHPWEPLDYGQGMRYEPRWGDAANSSRSLYLMTLPGKETGVRQAVHLPVHRVERFTGSVWVKHTEGPAALTVSLRRRNRVGEVLARAPIALNGRDWRRYEFSLDLKPGAVARLEPVDFVLSAENETRALLDQAFLFPADHLGGLDPDMVEMCRALRTPLVRFGGNYTSGYHWRDGVGPMDKRVSMLNQAWGMPEYNHFGTDEFLDFCRRVGAEPQICLNLGSGTPEEAAEWVRYVNAKMGRDGLLWELGNELWGTFQIGYPTIDRVAERTRRFREAVRAVDTKARLIATGQDPDHFREWNARQLTLPAGSFDYLATHFVVGNGNVRRKEATPEFLAQSALALPVGLERALREMKKQIDEAGAGERVKIAFTEWLFHGPDDRVPRFTNLGGALCTAGFLNTLIRVAGFTPVSDMTGLIEFGGVWKKRGRVYGVPAYWAFRMYSTADIATPVETRVKVETYDVTEGNNRIPEIPAVPYLDVVAARNETGGLLTLFVVNRHLTRDLTAELRIRGFTPAAEARAQTLSGTSIYQPNDEARPEAVHPLESVVRVGPQCIFPRASVTVLEFRRSGT